MSPGTRILKGAQDGASPGKVERRATMGDDLAVTATAVVAIVGAVSTPGVALLGYVYGERRSRSDREAARLLARDEQKHEREMLVVTNRHSSSLRTTDRIYEDRKSAYLTALGFAMDVADANTRIATGMADDAAPLPFNGADRKVWERIRIDIAAFGSLRVDHAMTAFSDAAQRSDTAIHRWRRAAAQESGADEAWTEMTTSNSALVDAVLEVRTGINADLAPDETAGLAIADS
jgi:hypothetical protein